MPNIPYPTSSRPSPRPRPPITTTTAATTAGVATVPNPPTSYSPPPRFHSEIIQYGHLNRNFTWI